MTVFHRLAFEQLHHEKRAAFVRSALDDVVVEHLHDARMVHAVRGVTFAEKSFAQLGTARERRMKNLHRGARAIAMNARVHRGHSADADETLERPLVVERAANALLRSLVAVVAHGVTFITPTSAARPRNDNQRRAPFRCTRLRRRVFRGGVSRACRLCAS